MPTRRGPVLKKLRHYLSQMPPENILPHKKLNAASRSVLSSKGLEGGLGETLEAVQQRLLAAYLRMIRRREMS